MALPKEDASIGSLSDIINKTMANTAQVPAEPVPQQEPPTETVVEDKKEEPKAEPTTTEEITEVPKEKVVEWTTKDGQTKTVKIAPDATLESLARKAKEYEDGMRKFQKERDELTKRYGKETDDMIGKFKTLEKALKYQGIEGVIDALAGKEGAAAEYKKLVLY